MPVGEWRHNDIKSQWELGEYDVPRKKWTVYGYITDEFLARVAASKEEVAVKMLRRYGSVPPPLKDHLPPESPVVFKL